MLILLSKHHKLFSNSIIIGKRFLHSKKGKSRRTFYLNLSFECITVSVLALGSSFPDVFDPDQVERDWYQWWKENEYFRNAKPGNKTGKETFSMILPPPNVTGTLHLGHALTVAIQDSLCRW